MEEVNFILGWREWIALPELGVRAIKVKVDTGARTSALHAEEIKIFRNRRTGLRTVRFALYPRRDKTRPIRVKFPLKGLRKVTSSGGHTTRRPVIEAQMSLNGLQYPIEITLVNRDIMGFRMLLGRTALKPGCLVNPNATYLLPRPRKLRTSQ